MHVDTVPPEFVATKMTAGLRLLKSLTGNSEALAGIIFLAAKKVRGVTFTWLDWRDIVFWHPINSRNHIRADDPTTTIQQNLLRAADKP